LNETEHFMADHVHPAGASSPVQSDESDRPEIGIALCLSGGGYRAMLFHAGALLRLDELGYLPRLDRVSTVSGGSITAGALAMNWARLQFDATGVAANFDDELVQLIRRLASITIDKGSILGGILTRGTISDNVAAAYRKHLFGETALHDFPERPTFVINATNVQTRALWRFSKPYMADYKVGMIRDPRVPVAVAVAASCAFPPILSLLRLKVDPASSDPPEQVPPHAPPYTTDVVLSDGGVYDNLGFETPGSATRRSSLATAEGRWSPSHPHTTTGHATPFG
jgi:NTE family protein